MVDLGDGRGLVTTTDFFMPIVDDPFDFGRIAAANAISDVYAMGGTPAVAIAILGWPIGKLPEDVAGRVVAGGRAVCRDAGIVLAGGHSIDNPEPLFGLAVNGLVQLDQLKTNAGGRPGDLLWLTKPLGLGLLTTAEKRGKLLERDKGLATRVMVALNKVGVALAPEPAVHAVTDVTGFGLVGHLSEICLAAGVGAELDWGAVPRITDLTHYLAEGTVPGGTRRNAASYAELAAGLSEEQTNLLFDPQTSGGLLVAAAPDAADRVRAILAAAGLEAHAEPVGQLTSAPGLRVV